MVIPVDHTKGKYWGGTQLNFTLFKWTSIFLGFLGIDHLLLRSPTTAAIKVFANILTLGYFYFYDVIQVLTEEKKVLEKGLSMPMMGYMGIGEGIFTKPGAEPAPKTSPKPYMFAVYCIAVLIGFGFDFLIAGDFPGAAAKIFSMFPLLLWGFTFIFWFFTLLWYFYTISRTYFYTKHVLSTDKENKYRGVGRFFPFTAIMKPYHIPFKTFIPPGEVVKECDKPLGFPWNMIAAFWTAPANAVKGVVEAAVQPAQTVLETGRDVAKAGATVLTEGAKAVGESVHAAAVLAPQIGPIVDKAGHLIELAQAQQPQKGGAISSMQEYILLGGLVAVGLGGFGLTFIRGLKNGSPADDDRPPEPRTGRKPLF